MQQQHLYSTYTPSTYGNLEPSSISYALVTPDLYNGNQTMALHSTMMRPTTMQTNQPSTANATGLYNHTLPHNLRMYPYHCIDFQTGHYTIQLFFIACIRQFHF